MVGVMGTLSSIVAGVQAVAALKGVVPYARKIVSSKSDVDSIDEETAHPLTLLAKVSLLSVLEVGTRIGQKKNKIVLQPPGLQQKLERTLIYPSSRNLLSIFTRIIRRAELLYKPSQNEEIKEIFLKAANGFERLKETYASDKDITNAAIDGMIGQIKNACKMGDVKAGESAQSEELNEFDTSYNEIWNQQKIQEFLTLFKKVEARQQLQISSQELQCSSVDEIRLIKAFIKIQDRDENELQPFISKQKKLPEKITIEHKNLVQVPVEELSKLDRQFDSDGNLAM